MIELLDVACKKSVISNGLEVILYKNSNVPLVSVNIWYKAGTANEITGKSGLAHLFEHMMFQGSQNVPKEMHFKYIQEAGGTLNGSTSFDRTNYYEKLPSNFLELALWLESDRMGFFLPAVTQEKLDNQKDVVKNERLERYDNQPYGLAWELIVKNLYPENHPYSKPTIGFLKDIESYNLEDVIKFFQTYYSPNNASLVIAGDFDADNILELVNKYFGEIRSNGLPQSPALPTNHLNANKEIIYEDNVQLERIYFAWPTVKVYHQDDAVLEIISDIISGSKNSRLYKKLVFEKELAQDVSAFQFSGKYGGHFMIVLTAKPGIMLDDLKKEVFDEVNQMIQSGVSAQDLVRTKNGIKSNFIYSLQNIDTLADQLNMYNFYLNEPNSFYYDLSRYSHVDEIKVKEILKKYLLEPYLTLKIIPKKK
ncbi:MAG TPA: pitrilysin family protein [Ignavibacteriaceae bacterium]